jgi:hypothetical protein
MLASMVPVVDERLVGSTSVNPGQKAKYSLRAHMVRYAPETGLKSDIAGGPVGAKTGNGPVHSIASEASASSSGGMSRPSAQRR